VSSAVKERQALEVEDDAGRSFTNIKNNSAWAKNILP